MGGKRFNILYLAHDLADSTVHKRVAQFKDGGADVTVIGFYRTSIPPLQIHDCSVIPLARTYDGQFLHRVITTLRAVAGIHSHRALFQSSDVIVARTLEMLSVAVRGRSLCKPPPPLVYESLDIHRLLLKSGVVEKIMRGLEQWLCQRAALVMTSSPAFIRDYFKARTDITCPIILIENKVYVPDFSPPFLPPRPAGPPWRIGWFGAIRCAKSLAILTRLAREMKGQVEIIIRGKPSYDQFDDFDAQVAGIDGLRFEGPYKNPDDLAHIYGDVHFTWAIDMFEEGLNSSWLLPNRLYEGGVYGSIPLTQSHVETGRTAHGIGTGVQLDNPLYESTLSFFRHLTQDQYRILKDKAVAVPLSHWVMTREEAVELVNLLQKLKGSAP